MQIDHVILMQIYCRFKPLKDKLADRPHAQQPADIGVWLPETVRPAAHRQAHRQR